MAHIRWKKWGVPRGSFPRQPPVGLSDHWRKGCVGGVCAVGARHPGLSPAEKPCGVSLTSQASPRTDDPTRVNPRCSIRPEGKLTGTYESGEVGREGAALQHVWPVRSRGALVAHAWLFSVSPKKFDALTNLATRSVL